MKLLTAYRTARRFAFAAICVALSGCAFNRNSIEPTYVPPSGDVGTLTIVGPQRSASFAHVEVCTQDGWKKPGILGGGWMVLGGMVVADWHELAANPQAHPMPNHLTFSVAANQRIHLRVRSHPTYSGGMISECTNQTSFVPRSGGKYRSEWGLGEKSCRLGLAEELSDGTLARIPHDDSKPSCIF